MSLAGLAAAGSGHGAWRRALAFAAAALAAAALYWPVLHAGFVYDDLPLLRDNPFLRSWSGMWRAFGLPLWETVSPSRYAAGFYRPMGVAAFTALWHAGGGAPWPFHAASLALHALCSVLVVSLALRLGWRPLAAGFGGLLFAVHGAHAEPVAWASSLTYLLAASGALLALRALVARRFAACAVWLLLAALSHETALGAAALCFLVALARDGRRCAGTWLLLLPVAAVYGLRAHAFRDWGAGLTAESIFDFLDPAHAYDWLDRTGLALSLMARYAAFLIWPWPHAPFRPLRVDRQIADPALWAPAVAGAAALAAAALLALRQWRRRGPDALPILLPLGIWLATLAPALRVRSLGQFPFEERFLYLPSAGFSMLAAALLCGIRPPGPSRRRWSMAAARCAAGGAVVLAMLHAASARAALPHWRDNETFVQWARASAPQALASHLEYASEILRAARELPERTAAREQAIERALRALRDAQELKDQGWFIHPVDWVLLHALIGSALLLDRDFPSAEVFYRKVLEEIPGSPDIHTGMGNLRAMQGEEALRNGRAEEGRSLLEEALTHFQAALDGDPALREALLGKGRSLALLGRQEEGIPPLQRAFALDPGSAPYAGALVETLLQTRRYTEARRVAREHMEQAPASASGPLLHGIALAAEGEERKFAGDTTAFLDRTREALPWFQRALDLDPASPAAAFQLGRCLFELGRVAEALPLLEAAFAADPADPSRAIYLATAQETRGFPGHAAGTMRKHIEAAPASKLRPDFEAAIPRLLERIPAEPQPR